MTSRLTLDKAGRIVLPKPMRDELQLQAGDAIEIESTGEELTLRPVRGQGGIHKKQGVWVFQAGDPLTQAETEAVRREIRQERNNHLGGKTNRKR